MKYITILGDGMADYIQPFLDNKTPLMIANKPTIDSLCGKGELGLAKTVPFGMKPGSDVANLSVLGYDPKECYTGRSSLEAESIGIKLEDSDVTLRANLVTLSNEENYADKTIIDYSAGEISTEEAKELISYLKEHLDCKEYTLYAGISYRHCLVAHGGKVINDFTPPHDITGKKIKEYLPKTDKGKEYLALMQKSYELLKNHPINLKRIAGGKNPASSLWFWGEGTKPKMQDFYQKFGVKGVMISAVDLLKGIGVATNMQVAEVDGATGNYDTNFLGKAKKVVEVLRNGADFVYLHMEAPDECGHHGDAENKIYSIEQISEVVVKYIIEQLEKDGEDFNMLICPDHPTPLNIKTHSADPIPYILFRSKMQRKMPPVRYDEINAKNTGVLVENGYELMLKLLEKI